MNVCGGERVKQCTSRCGGAEGTGGHVGERKGGHLGGGHLDRSIPDVCLGKEAI